MLEQLQSIDRALFVFLNGLGSPSWDAFWLLLSEKTIGAPLVLFFLWKRTWNELFFVQKKESNAQYLIPIKHELKIIFLKIVVFHGQRQAFQLVIYNFSIKVT